MRVRSPPPAPRFQLLAATVTALPQRFFPQPFPNGSLNALYDKSALSLPTPGSAILRHPENAGQSVRFYEDGGAPSFPLDPRRRQRQARTRGPPQNPKLAPFRHGFRAQRATTALLVDAGPDLDADYQRRLTEAGYTSVREERVLAEALLHRFPDRADLMTLTRSTRHSSRGRKHPNA